MTWRKSLAHIAIGAIATFLATAAMTVGPANWPRSLVIFGALGAIIGLVGALLSVNTLVTLIGGLCAGVAVHFTNAYFPVIVIHNNLTTNWTAQDEQHLLTLVLFVTPLVGAVPAVVASLARSIRRPVARWASLRSATSANAAHVAAGRIEPVAGVHLASTSVESERPSAPMWFTRMQALALLTWHKLLFQMVLGAITTVLLVIALAGGSGGWLAASVLGAVIGLVGALLSVNKWITVIGAFLAGLAVPFTIAYFVFVIMHDEVTERWTKQDDQTLVVLLLFVTLVVGLTPTVVTWIVRWIMRLFSRGTATRS